MHVICLFTSNFMDPSIYMFMHACIHPSKDPNSRRVTSAQWVRYLALGVGLVAYGSNLLSFLSEAKGCQSTLLLLSLKALGTLSELPSSFKRRNRVLK